MAGVKVSKHDSSTKTHAWWAKTSLVVMIITTLLYSIIGLLGNAILIIGFEAQQTQPYNATTTISPLTNEDTTMANDMSGEHRDSNSFARNFVMANTAAHSVSVLCHLFGLVSVFSELWAMALVYSVFVALLVVFLFGCTIFEMFSLFPFTFNAAVLTLMILFDIDLCKAVPADKTHRSKSTSKPQQKHN